ncbi:hypothetical protein PPL19_10342 [Pseudomonas psychrotolerans L19]|nr:hypothetical protein PPL19_10342 [Pseudomonas psychrotolerans L19]
MLGNSEYALQRISSRKVRITNDDDIWPESQGMSNNVFFLKAYDKPYDRNVNQALEMVVKQGTTRYLDQTLRPVQA